MNNYIEKLIREEKEREEKTINLIASENYVPQNVLNATGSILTNKYAEGYPGKRYYGGCQVVDKVEKYAINQGKKLFKAEHLNVQPHSGSSANFAIYLSLLKPGDTILGMSLSSGGHLTHGHKVNFSGKIFNFIPYNVSPENEMLDYEEIELLANQHQPKMIVAGASAYSRIIDFKKLNSIAKRNKALLFVDIAHIAGLIAAGVHPSPVPFADFVSSTTHKTLRGPRGGIIISKTEYAEKIDRSVMPGSQGGPLMHVIAAKAVAFDNALSTKFIKYQKQVIKNAKIMSTEFKNLGYRIVANGTDNHLFLIDLRNKNISGKEAEITLEKCGIVVNSNSIPFDPKPPTVNSGIRIGTPAVTTRGFIETDISKIAHWVDEALSNKDNEQILSTIKVEVEKNCKKFPIYQK